LLSPTKANVRRKMDKISDELQCPVCLLIPREVPIPACPVGHIICKTCRGNMTTCPTCRRLMPEDGTNTLANKMIELVPHSCKYSKCQVKNYLKEIEEHEARCPERAVKCPYLYCNANEEVKVSEFKKHAIDKDCTFYSSDFLSKGTIKSCIETSSGESIQSVVSEDRNWKMRAFEDHGKLFYFHRHYFSAEQTFAFYVTMAEHDSEAEKHLAKMTLKHQNDWRKSLSFTQNVISMDSAPSDINSVLSSKSVMFVPWRTMSGFLKWEDETVDGKQSSKSIIETTLDIYILVN